MLAKLEDIGIWGVFFFSFYFISHLLVIVGLYQGSPAKQPEVSASGNTPP